MSFTNFSDTRRHLASIASADHIVLADAEVRLSHQFVLAQALRRVAQDNLAGLEHVTPVSDLQGHAGILLDRKSVV